MLKREITDEEIERNNMNLFDKALKRCSEYISTKTETLDTRWVAIFGTIIFHLIVAILFMAFKFKTINSKMLDDMYGVEFIPEEMVIVPPIEEQEKIDLPKSELEDILSDNEEMLNFARNLANSSNEVDIDVTDLINSVKNELIENGLLGEDNFIDAQNRVEEFIDSNSEESLAFSEDNFSEPSDSQILEANYQGATRIYYNLDNRNHTYLPIPIYKCQGYGVITLDISVGQNGRVSDAKINVNESSTNDDCLIETAIESALKSRFNADMNAPKSQQGTLTYHFVAQ